MITTVGEFIIGRLKTLGIHEIIGVPGDFNLSFLEQIEAADGIRFVGTCNELGAAYAADGYARLRGIGCVLTTYGVGELSALNAIAGARAEHVPVISIAGAPPQYATEYRWPMHHSLADGNYDNTLDAFRPFTERAIRVSPANVVEEFDSAVHACLREKRPVHIQIPSDIMHLEVEVHDTEPARPYSDTEMRRAAVDMLLARLARAQRPAILLDQDAARHGFADILFRIATQVGIPYAHMASAKAVLPERHPLCLGTYNGKACAPDVRERVESSDFLVTTNPRFIEGNSGGFTQDLPAGNIVNLGDQHVMIGDDFFVGIHTRDVLDDIATALGGTNTTEGHATPPPAFDVTPKAPLTQHRLWPRLANVIADGDVVIAEAGTSSIGLGAQPMPDGVTYITSPIWGSIGFTLPALLGSMLAAPHRRHLLFIGDGSFQLTAQELSTILRQKLCPLIFLINNRGYTIERYILGMEREYNDVQNWRYTELPRVFAPGTTMRTYQASTEGELEAVLNDIGDAPGGAFVELHLDALDAPAGLQSFGPQTAEFDFGPRGPRNP